MPIFKESEGKLKKLNAISLDKEKKLQQLVENNLQEVLDMFLLETEYVTTFGGRIDTLAVDANGCPVIIEYKRNSNDNVINQALSYLKWLQAQKVEFFEMLLIKRLGKEVADQIEIDWKNPRVICIAENYNKFDTDTVEVIPIKIELYKYRFYENSLFSIELLNGVEQKESRSIKNTEQKLIDSNINNISVPTDIAECFKELRSRIFALDESISEIVTNKYTAFKVSKNFAEIHVGKNKIRILLRPAEYNDPKRLLEKIPESYNWSLDRRIYLNSIDELDYIMSLVEQSYTSIL